MSAFGPQLRHYQQVINEDIAAYTTHVQKITRQQYGEYPAAVTEEYVDLLTRGGKRIRGALAMVGYELLAGRDMAMITRAATALEMIHAAVLIIDDIQDNDDVRRGKPAVHTALAAYHNKLGMQGRAKATGISLAVDAALTGMHAAQVLLAGLEAEPELKIKVLGIVNQTIVQTAHGQTYDIVNAGLSNPKPEDLARATEWKSAHYTFLNPLCVGLVLAGAGCEDTDAIRDYALHTGIAFQLTDDVMDGDIAAPDVPSARQAAEQHVKQAITALRRHAHRWEPGQVQFLEELATFVVTRRE